MINKLIKIEKRIRTIFEARNIKEILPRILVAITGHQRYLPKIEWSNKLWTHNVFRFYELIFWRRFGIRHEMTTLLENGRITHTCHSLESIFVLSEQYLREFFATLKLKPFKIYIPILQTPQGIPLFASPYLFAIAYDNSIDVSINPASNTVAYTCSGSNRYLMVGTLKQSSRYFTSVTYSGTGMTEIGTKQFYTAASEYVQTWSLLNPASGSNNIVGTDTGAGTVGIIAASYTGVDTSALDTSNIASSATATNITNTMTTTADNCWLVGYFRFAGTITAGSNTTLRRSASNINMGDTNAAQTPAGSHSIAGTHNPTNDFVYIGGVAIKPYVDPPLTISVSDTLTLTESVVMLITSFINVNDSLSITESVALNFVNIINVSDNLSITESVVVLNTQLGGVNIFDAISLTESVVVQNTQLGNLSVSDSITISETITTSTQSFINIFDTISITETVVINSVYNLSVFDSIIITDTVVEVQRLDRRSGIAHMRSLGNNRPFAMDPRVDYEMKSNQQNRPLGMDDLSIL